MRHTRDMARWTDVARILRSLPDVEEGEPRGWGVHGKPLAWERPLRARDLAELGTAAPKGDILCVRTNGSSGKEELLAADPEVYFTTSHFNGYPAVLVRLAKISVPELRELLTDAWLAQAPKRLVKEYLSSIGTGR
jgi:hypothetical protein